jgi:hypothetical protein
MPVITLGDLTQDENLHAIAARLSRMSPGLLLTTGQSRSGKMTTLLALAHVIAKPGERVVILADRPSHRVRSIRYPNRGGGSRRPFPRGWDTALGSPGVSLARCAWSPRSNRDNLGAIASCPPGQWLLATLDSA